jgi:hypothetical protein
MLAWLRDLTARERKTMLACWGGWTLDGFDQQLYSYVVPTVIAVWGMSTGAAGTIGTVTVVTSSFGGWFAGALADRFGRVRVAADRDPVVFGLHLRRSSNSTRIAYAASGTRDPTEQMHRMNV